MTAPRLLPRSRLSSRSVSAPMCQAPAALEAARAPASRTRSPPGFAGGECADRLRSPRGIMPPIDRWASAIGRNRPYDGSPRFDPGSLTGIGGVACPQPLKAPQTSVVQGLGWSPHAGHARGIEAFSQVSPRALLRMMGLRHEQAATCNVLAPYAANLQDVHAYWLASAMFLMVDPRPCNAPPRLWGLLQESKRSDGVGCVCSMVTVCFYCIVVHWHAPCPMDMHRAVLRITAMKRATMRWQHANDGRT